MKKSNLDVAFELISKKKKPVDFLKLWEEVSTIQGLTVEEANARVSKFYSQLSVDGRFITFNGTSWQLRTRVEFKKIDEAIKKNIVDDVEEENTSKRKNSDSGDLDDMENDDDSSEENDDDSEYENEEY